MKIVIIGGVAGGATVATRLRRLSEDVEIVMFEKDEFVAFANCGLPYYIGREITDRSKLLVQTVEGLKRRFNIDVRVNSEVTRIDSGSKCVSVSGPLGEEYLESYDKLIIATGANPIVPAFESLNSADNVFTLRNIADMDKIVALASDVNRAVVVGGGFIGVEMAENLASIGVDVTLVDGLDHILRPFDYEMAAFIELELKKKGIKVITKENVVDIDQDFVYLKGEKLATDMTILAIGVKPNNKLCDGTSIVLNERGFVKVSNSFETSIEDIYAVGDVIEVVSAIDDASTNIALAWPANRQARALADVLLRDKKFDLKFTGASVIKVFDYTAASVGFTGELLDFKGVEYDSVVVSKSSHASYYPGSEMIILKLIFDATGKVLGAQAIGKKGVEKRIDIISALIKKDGSVSDLEDLEVCYAPPYNSAKDIVNIAGYAANNKLDGLAFSCSYDVIDSLENCQIVDVRSSSEFDRATISGAVNIDVDELRGAISENKLDKDRPVYVFCQIGLRGYLAQRILLQSGFKNVYNLDGGYQMYNAVKLNEKR